MHLSLSLGFLLLHLTFTVQGQTFQYSRGWTNGKRSRGFPQSSEVPAASAAFVPTDDVEVHQPLSLFGDNELLDLVRYAVTQDVRLRRRLKRLLKRIESINSRHLLPPKNSINEDKDEDETSCECTLQSTVENHGRR